MYIFNEYLISTKAERESLLLDQAKLLIFKTLHCKELRFAKPTKQFHGKPTYGVFTLSDTDADTDTDTDKMGLPVSVSGSMNTSTQFLTHFFIGVCVCVGQCEHSIIR